MRHHNKTGGGDADVTNENNHDVTDDDADDVTVLSERKLMHCPPEIETNMGCASSLMSGVLPLHEGDEIYVKVSHPHLLVANSMTYFAMWRI